jgi:hypothetical protein
MSAPLKVAGPGRQRYSGADVFLTRASLAFTCATPNDSLYPHVLVAPTPATHALSANSPTAPAMPRDSFAQRSLGTLHARITEV